MSNYFSIHTHSNFSCLDAMTSVQSNVEKAAWLGQPAIGLMDHGNMAGAIQLYQQAKKNGLKPFIGTEGYLIDPDYPDWENPTKGTKVGRYHFGLSAFTEEGYKGLVKFSSLTHTRPRFNRFPRATLEDLAQLGTEYGDGIAFTTGCYFGLIVQTLIRQGYDAAKKRVAMFAHWFPNTFVELQNHDIFHTDDPDILPEFQHDDDIVKALVQIADELGLPVIVGQDSHYTDQRQKKAHALMKRMTYGGTDDEFPGDSFHFASGEWVSEHYEEDVWEKVELGFGKLLDLWDLHIEPLDNYKPDVPRISKAPKRQLAKRIEKGLTEYLDANPKRKVKERQYRDRIEYELDVINHIGMAEYFNIVADYVQWCHEEGICVEARGSGNGSLVCFVTGITQVDPVLLKIDFDRFLTKDRTSPPDIDMDIEDSRRMDLLRYLMSKHDAIQIGTWGKLGTRYDEREDREVGSILQTWLTSKRRETEAFAIKKFDREGKGKGDAIAYGKGMFNRMYSGIKDIRDVEAINRKDYLGLLEMSSMEAYRSYGVHAGGILLSGQRIKIDDYIPTMLVASSNTTVTQYDMEDVEELGLLKMDVLGQATLRVMRLAQEAMGAADPTDFAWIPDDDPAATKILREGRTDNGIFHFEGYTKAKGGKEMGIKSTLDTILAQALYMPGAMESGQTAHFVRARRDPQFRKSITYLHPIFERHLKPTNGAYVFQNQVMSILRDMGMDVISINKFLKVVKASGSGAAESNQLRLDALKEVFDKLWLKHNIDPAERDHTWEALCGFGKYGFNHAHAAGYGIRSYRCAYLKAHYPLEFMAGLLQTWAGRPKETLYIKEARRLEIRLMPPDVNTSHALWTLDPKRKGIRKGLLSIAGIGETAAQAIVDGAPYRDVTDLAERVPGRQVSGGKNWLKDGELTGKLAALDKARALDSLPKE